ncbi:MAG: hypothetical protein JWP63_2692 [Candidatus Solibacter sp.]|nr:hypothetical protein [Candidatus Solibacter sp.]
MPPRPKPTVISTAPLLSRELRIALTALCALFLFGLFSREIYDSDFWWHLRTGQYIVEHRALPAPDPFSWTTSIARDVYPGESRTRYFNLTHEWLAQAAIYGVWRIAGFPGVVAARALTMTAFCGLVGLVAWKRRGSFFAALAAALAAASVARLFAFDRPYHVTYFFLAATLAILEFRRFLWLLPPLFLIWANSHGGYFLGWILLGAWCVQSLVERRRDRALWLTSAASILASGVNPNGFQTFRALLDYRQSFLQTQLLEWTRPVLWPPSEFSVLLLASLAALIWARRRARVADWLIWIAFAAASLSAYRNIILVGLFAPIVLVAYAPWKLRMPAIAPYALAFLLIAATGFGAMRGSFFQFRAAEWKYPSGAAAFLTTHHIDAPLFNTYEYGGYLMWRGLRTFIDGRALSESVFQDYARILYNHDASDGRPSGEDLLARYGVQVIVMNTFEPSTAPIYLLAPALADPAQTTWKLVYNDPQALIFMRTPPAGVTPLNSLDVLTHMEDECSLHLAHEPEYPRCARSLGQIFSKVGDFERARKWIGAYLDHPHPPDPEAENAYRQMLR